MENFNVKLQEQIKRLMATDKIYYTNGIEISNKVANGSGVYSNIPQTEFVENLRKGTSAV